MRIGELAGQANVSVQTVRYYERRGLLPAPDRTGSGYRQFSEHDVLRLRFILDAKRLGFTLSEIQELLELRVDPATTVEDVRDRARAKVETTKARIEDLRRIQRTLEDLIAACDAGHAPDECALMHAIVADHTHRGGD